MSGPEDGGAFRPEGEPALFDSDLRVDDPEPTAAAVVDGKAAVPFLSSSSSSEAAAAARPNQDDAGGQETDELREANLPEAVCRHHPDQDDDDDDDNKAGGRCQADTALAADDAQVAPGPTRKISCDDATPNVKRRRSMREKNVSKKTWKGLFLGGSMDVVTVPSLTAFPFF